MSGHAHLMTKQRREKVPSTIRPSSAQRDNDDLIMPSKTAIHRQMQRRSNAQLDDHLLLNKHTRPINIPRHNRQPTIIPQRHKRRNRKPDPRPPHLQIQRLHLRVPRPHARLRKLRPGFGHADDERPAAREQLRGQIKRLRYHDGEVAACVRTVDIWVQDEGKNVPEFLCMLRDHVFAKGVVVLGAHDGGDAEGALGEEFAALVEGDAWRVLVESHGKIAWTE